MRRIMLLYAHPDDETFGPGGTIAKYAREGVHIELVCATRGEAGEIADPSLATPENLGEVREQEMLCAADTLGIRKVHFLDYRDSGMEGSDDNGRATAFVNAPRSAVVPRLVTIMRGLRPHLLFTFEPFGGYGHPDHVAIHEHALAAYEAAADAGYRPELGAPWQAARVFYPLLPDFLFEEMKQRMAARDLDLSFFQQFEEWQDRRWPDDQIHAVIDVSATVETKWDAAACHRTQIGEDNVFHKLPRAEMNAIFSKEYFALARPLPPPGLHLDDLFAGLDLSET